MDNKAVWKWHLQGEAFGATDPDQDPDGDGASFQLNMRFPGQRAESTSGLNYNYFRDYDPTVGRYGQSDPLGLGAGISTYGYVASAPVEFVDSEGLQVEVLPPLARPWMEMAPVKPWSTPIDPVIPFEPGQDWQPPSEKCRSLWEKIKNLRKEIFAKRIPDLDANPRNLPWRLISGLERLRDTIRGHEILLTIRRHQLANAEDEFDRTCGPNILACL